MSLSLPGRIRKVNFEFEIIEKLLNRAENKYAQEDFAAAEISFRKALKRVDRLPTAKRNLPKFKNSQMKLAVSCYKQDKTQESQALFTDLTMDQAGTNNDAIRILQASQFLAQIFLTEKKFNEAESYSRKAMLGRRRIHGKDDCSYSESIALLSIIYKAKGDTEEAAIYEDMVPKEHEVLLTSLRERFLPKISETTAASESTSTVEYPAPLPLSEEPTPSPIPNNATPPTATLPMWGLRLEDESHVTWKEVISESPHISPEYETRVTVEVCIKPATQAILRDLFDEPADLVRKEIHSMIRALPRYTDYVPGDDVQELLWDVFLYRKSPRFVLQLLRDWTVAQNGQSKHLINNYGLVIDPLFFEHTTAYGIGRDALNFAALRGDPQNVALLLSVGASIDHVDHVGRTPLHYAAMYN